MNKKDVGWLVLGIEIAAFAYQKGVVKHPLGCTCNTCITINVSLPITLGVTLSLDDNKLE